MAYTPTYTTDANTGKTLAPIAKTGPAGLTIAGKLIPGYQTTYKDGTSKWISSGDAQLNSGYDYSTFTGKKDASSNWVWTPTTSNSVQNLANSTGVTATQVKQSLYENKSIATTLNGNRVNQLGGISAAKKVSSNIPGASGSVSPNIAPTTAPTAAAGPQIEGTQQDLLNNESVKDKDGGWRKKYENLRYPIVRDPKQDYILFTMKRYSPRSFDVAAASSVSGNIFGDRDNRTPLGSVSLPIQPNIADSNSVKWGEDPMESLDALTQGVFTSAVSGNAGQGADNAGAIVTPALGPLKSAGVAELAGRATGTNKSLFTRTTGAVFNPNVELLFTGPSLRGFQFNFSLSAREDSEAKEIKKIIRFFKQGMSVKRAASTLFLKAPNTFDIKYVYGKDNIDHPWINKIKECALQNFTVNYTPAGNYATFEDGAMTQYDLGLTFMELDPIYDDDYTALDKGITDQYIGY